MFDNVSKQSKAIAGVKPSSFMTPKKGAVSMKPSGSRKTEEVMKCERFINNFSRIFGLIVIVFLLFSITLLLGTYYFNINNLNRKISQVNAEYKQKSLMVQSFSGLSSSLDEIEASSVNFDRMLPESKDLSGVLVKLEQMALKYELVFNSINNTSTEIMVKESVGQKIKKQQYEIVLSGSDYFTLKNYLSDIEKNLRIIDVRSLVYSPDINMFFLNFEIYYLD